MKEFEGGRCLVSNRVIDQMLALRAAEVDGVLAVAGFDSESGTLRRDVQEAVCQEVEAVLGLACRRVNVHVL